MANQVGAKKVFCLATLFPQHLHRQEEASHPTATKEKNASGYLDEDLWRKGLD